MSDVHCFEHCGRSACFANQFQENASWHWIFLINLPVGIAGCIATLMIMPNYKMQTRRFDISGFVMLAVCMATLTLALPQAGR